MFELKRVRASSRTKGLVFGEQRIAVTGKVCVSEYMLDLCDEGLGNCLINKAT